MWFIDNEIVKCFCEDYSTIPILGGQGAVSRADGKLKLRGRKREAGGIDEEKLKRMRGSPRERVLPGYFQTAI